jgi:C1A family cysteine protease
MYKICKAAAYFGFQKFCDEPVSLELEQSFADHVSKFGLSFGTKEEYEFRFGLYAQVDAEINQINAKETSFSVAHNFMSTWTDFEYKQLLGYKGQGNEVRGETVFLPETNAAEVDWVTAGAVNLAVKNQYHCGGCWAFSAMVAVEGAEFIKTGSLLNLSEQQVIDCDTTSYGCKGGW